jgi:hypothetical protein
MRGSIRSFRGLSLQNVYQRLKLPRTASALLKVGFDLWQDLRRVLSGTEHIYILVNVCVAFVAGDVILLGGKDRFHDLAAMPAVWLWLSHVLISLSPKTC